ncbi:hypothetical protein [Streptomyces nigrescens]|uniref:hypothetical protein n=1 Tax=Streptomyces nigrescens TaxID=1920 RepID=UPI000AA374F0
MTWRELPWLPVDATAGMLPALLPPSLVAYDVGAAAASGVADRRRQRLPRPGLTARGASVAALHVVDVRLPPSDDDNRRVPAVPAYLDRG